MKSILKFSRYAALLCALIVATLVAARPVRADESFPITQCSQCQWDQLMYESALSHGDTTAAYFISVYSWLWHGCNGDITAFTGYCWDWNGSYH